MGINREGYTIFHASREEQGEKYLSTLHLSPELTISQSSVGHHLANLTLL
jgi:hypothetical protein